MSNPITVEIRYFPTGLVLSDLMVDYVFAQGDLTQTPVSQSGITLTEVGNGVYQFTYPDVTVALSFGLHVTADATTRIDGYWPLQVATAAAVAAIPTTPLLAGDTRLPATMIATSVEVAKDATVAKTDTLMKLDMVYDAAKTAASQTSVNTANSNISAIIATLGTLVSSIWAYANRKLTSALTDEVTPRDMAATGGNMFTGTQPVTITAYETATTTPIIGMLVSVLNAAGTYVYGTVLTDDNGQTKDGSGNDLIMLDTGVAAGYKLAFRKAGVTIATVTLSQAEVIAGGKTVYGTVFVPAVPSPGSQSLYGLVFASLDQSASTDIVSAEITDSSIEVDGAFFQKNQLDSTITAGYFSLIVPWYAQIRVSIPKGASYLITVSPDDYRDLSDYIDKGEATKISQQ